MVLRRNTAIARVFAICAIILGVLAFSLVTVFNKTDAISPTENEPADAVNAVAQKMKANAVYDCLVRMTRYPVATINGYYDGGANGDNKIRENLIYYVYDVNSSSAWDDENAVKVPFKLGDTYIADGGVSCDQVLNGYDPLVGSQNYTPIVPASKIAYVTSTDDMLQYMEGLGYTWTMDTSSITKRGCLHLELQTNDSPVDDATFFNAYTGSSVNNKHGYTNDICFNLDDSNNVVSVSSEGATADFSGFNMTYHNHCGFLDLGTCDDNYQVYEYMELLYNDWSGYPSVYPYVHFSGSPMLTYGSLSDVAYYGDGGSHYEYGSPEMYPTSQSSSGTAMTWSQVKQFAGYWAEDIKDYDLLPDYQMGSVWLNLCRDGNGVYYDSTRAQCGSSGYMASNGWSYVNVVTTEPVEGDDVGQRTWSSGDTDYSGALKYLTGMDLSESAYTDDDLYVLSHYFLSNYYNFTFHADASSDFCSHTTPQTTTIPVKIKSTGEIRYCEMLTLTEAVGGTEGTDEDADDGKVNAIASTSDRTLTKMDAYGLLAVMNSLNPSNVTDEHIVMIDDCSANPDADGCTGGGSGGGGTETPTPEEDECDPSIEANTKDVECQEKGCYKEAGSMGWIICPVIFGLHDFVDNIYDKHIAPLLSVDKGIVYDLAHMDNSSATYKGWAMFRNIANILFAIVLLVVVFSQVTGFGIDNYGVKKILPKLIVTAILVNLSYIICGVLVDISNMLGAGIKGLFEGAAGNITIAGVQSESAKMTGVILNGLLVLVAGGGIAAGAIAISSGAITGWSIVLPLLLIGLAAFLTVICALIVLGARQAIILILIVVSPFAFVCYALPNLNGVFKKWLKLFEAMLMVFPICGALVGGGYFASCIILGANSDGSILTLIISAIVCMVPYFLIPSVTGRAMNAVGGLAGRVMGMGRGVSNGIGNRARNSEAYKNRIKNSQDAARARAANRYLNSRRGRRDLATVEGGGTLNKHRSSRLSNALKMANADYAENKGILDEAQNRRDIASGSMAAVDAFKRDQGHHDLDDKAAHIGALTQAAEMERMDANNTREFADNNDSAAIEAEAIALAGAGLGDAANLSRYNAAMNRLAKIDPSAYRRAIDGSIAAGNHDVATRQAIKDNAITNSDVAKEQGLKDLLKANVTPTANNPTGQLSTANDYTKAQAGKSVKDMLALDDDYIADIANGNIQTDANIQETARMALQSMAANPKMAEDKKAEYLNNLVRIATNGTQSNYADYQANQAAIANQDLISVDLATGGQLTVDRREIPNGDAKQIDPTRSRRIASDEMQIVFKDGSQYNTKSKVFTPSHGGPNP